MRNSARKSAALCGHGRHCRPGRRAGTVYGIDGLDPSVAVAFGSSPTAADFFALDGKELPDTVQEYVDSQR
ncbi:MAG: DUF6281 family protein [Nocardioides sp.]